MRKRLLFVVAAYALLAIATASAQGTKWHPGHYVILNGGSTVDENMLAIAQLSNETKIQGVVIRFWWYALEPKFGEYDFSSIDTYLAALRQMTPPKRLIVRLMDRRFRTTDDSAIVPDYLLKDPIYNGGVIAARSRIVARLWEAPVMQRLISLYQALAQRFDSDPLFEGAFTEETPLGFPGPDLPPGYSDELLAAQYVVFIKAVKPMMPTSNLFLTANWLGASSNMINLFAEMQAAAVGAGDSNVVPGKLSLGQSVLTGAYGTDYRRVLPIANAIESGELDEFTPEEIGTYAYDVLQDHYLLWTRKTSGGTPDHQWFPGILHYLRTGPPTRTRCPNVYRRCVNADTLLASGQQNLPPTVSAGTDMSSQLPGGVVTLAGSVTDDGLPLPQLSVGWTQVSGPEPATIIDPRSPTSQVWFSAAGTYVLRLTASDGDLSASDEVTVTVTAAVTNQPPHVDAGTDVSIQLPTDTVTLTGSVTDDGMPNPEPSLRWSQVSGPSPVAFSATDKASVDATFASAGSYVLRLTADDGALESSDDVTVTVEPSPAGSGSSENSNGGATTPPAPSPTPTSPSANSGGSGSFGPLDLLLLCLVALARAMAARRIRRSR